MDYVGVDYHKRYMLATRIDAGGKVLDQVRIENTPEAVVGYFGEMARGTKVALEATGGWYHFYELVEGLGLDVVLAHPLKTRAIAEARIKTDKVDSAILAHLLRTDLLPTSYIPSRQIRDLRELLRYRASLVSHRAALKNKVHAILTKVGLRCPYSDVFGKQATGWLQGLRLRPCYRQAIDGYLQVGEALGRLIGQIKDKTEEMTQHNHQARLLMTVPGIGAYSALLILSEIGDVRRFPSARHLCSYAGLVPSVHSSGGRTRYGHITKQGSRWLRWIMVEVARHGVRGSVRFAQVYRRIAFKHGTNTAKVAVARHMLTAVFHMLARDEPFKDFAVAPAMRATRKLLLQASAG